MGGYGPPSRVMPNRLSSISMLMVWTVTPPCCSFIRFRCSNRPPGGEHAKKNQQRNDFHFFLILCQASMTPTLLVELGLEAIRHPRRPVLYRARYTTGRAYRRHRRCRHARLPMADQDGLHIPSGSPRTESISWLAKLTRSFATNLPSCSIWPCPGSIQRFGQARRVSSGQRCASGRFS
jgi:hypothetical protein